MNLDVSQKPECAATLDTPHFQNMNSSMTAGSFIPLSDHWIYFYSLSMSETNFSVTFTALAYCQCEVVKIVCDIISLEFLLSIFTDLTSSFRIPIGDT